MVTEDVQEIFLGQKLKFEKYFNMEFEKINKFYELQLNKCIKTWLLMKINLAVTKSLKIEPTKLQFMNELKTSYEQFYKDIILLTDFLNINEEAIKMIMKKLKNYQDDKMAAMIALPVINIKHQTKYSYVKNNINKLINLKQEVITVYLNNFYSNSQRSIGEKELEKIQNDQLLNQNEFFLFGFFIGICLVLLGLNAILFGYNNIKGYD